ncbi:GTP pyrophosphokinase [Nitrogeniibacter aestuarii]|uniref:GTP pyrophosphokinase n=1 Tax=Nitrogeniibacter aestuarii TaxID=2815343 RepID=UPI001D1110B4|nr:RelA/SpoT domain-containing protein [Nitrogeniibacter aestuarii]
MTREAELHSEYLDLEPSLTRLRKAMIEQLEHLVASCGLTLGVPIESRVKTWDSLVEKLARKGLRPKCLSDVDDLIGIRVIFLFQRDVAPFKEAISETFSVLSSEDTSQRLMEAQFGYKSEHYVIKMPADWERIPSLKGLSERKIELQVRTLAQHIWAAASHKLQYKHEDSVPFPVRRSIYRVSALLETVDLEFSRVLDEREEYVKVQAVESAKDDELNVSVLEAVLDELFPLSNKDRGAEDYSELIRDLNNFNVFNRGDLIGLIKDNLDEVLKSENKQVEMRRSDDDHDYLMNRGESVAERLDRGVFFNHVGLAREALRAEFGDDEVNDWLIRNSEEDFDFLA